MRAHPLRILAGIVLAASGTAQTTLVVDAAAGPGSQFTTIQAALDKAEDGDTIVVRAGLYQESLATSRGVHIVADPGVFIPNFTQPALTVTNLGEGKSFSLKGARFTGEARISLGDCAGRIHLESLQLPQTTVTSLVEIANCNQVTLTRVSAFGTPSTRIINSRVVLTDCILAGSNWTFPSSALTLVDADVTIVGGAFVGSPSAAPAAAPAIWSLNTTLTLAGRDTLVSAGQDGTGQPVTAIQTVLGTVDIDPAVTLVSRNGAPTIAGTQVIITTRQVPSVRTESLASLGTWVLDLHAPTDTLYCLFVATPVPRTLTPYGELWFSLGAFGLLGCGTVGPGDQVLLNLPAPVLPAGLALVAQAAVAFPGGVELTPPAINIVE